MMGVKKIDKQHLLDSAGYLFRTQGYHATSMEDIAKLCSGVNKASLYHHAKSKKSLALAVFQDLHQIFEERFFTPLRDPLIPPEQRIQNYLQGIEMFFIDRKGGCLMANMALEIGDTVPEFTAVLQTYFQAWIDALKHVLESLLPQENTEHVAAHFVAQLQGAILLSNLLKDKKPITHHRQDVLIRLKIKPYF